MLSSNKLIPQININNKRFIKKLSLATDFFNNKEKHNIFLNEHFHYFNTIYSSPQKTQDQFENNILDLLHTSNQKSLRLEVITSYSRNTYQKNNILQKLNRYDNNLEDSKISTNNISDSKISNNNLFELEIAYDYFNQSKNPIIYLNDNCNMLNELKRYSRQKSPDLWDVNLNKDFDVKSGEIKIGNQSHLYCTSISKNTFNNFFEYERPISKYFKMKIPHYEKYKNDFSYWTIEFNNDLNDILLFLQKTQHPQYHELNYLKSLEYNLEQKITVSSYKKILYNPEKIVFYLQDNYENINLYKFPETLNIKFKDTLPQYFDNRNTRQDILFEIMKHLPKEIKNNILESNKEFQPCFSFTHLL